jgi:hypothetical protein
MAEQTAGRADHGRLAHHGANAIGITTATGFRHGDLTVGLGIFLINLDAAREVYVAARKEHAEAQAMARVGQIYISTSANVDYRALSRGVCYG